jgi:PiT family inorganic phosphate transporter
MSSLLSAIFLGWALGANNQANVFGSAVSSKMVRFWTAAILASIFVLLGSLLEGESCINTYTGLTRMTVQLAVISSLASAGTVTLMTLFGLPVSTSQTVPGAIFAIGLLNRQLNVAGMEKVVACWFGTPVGGLVLAVLVYYGLAAVYNRLKMNLFQSDKVLRVCLIIAGAYGAYTLGANNVANVTAVFVGAGLLTVFSAVLIGGLSIGFGIMTYSRPVIETVGKKLVKLDAFSALVVVLAESITVHMYTFIGVPVSTSQAVVGAILGVGIIKGISTIRRRTMVNILLAWFLTPVVACLLTLLIDFVAHLKYTPTP